MTEKAEEKKREKKNTKIHSRTAIWKGKDCQCASAVVSAITKRNFHLLVEMTAIYIQTIGTCHDDHGNKDRSHSCNGTAGYLTVADHEHINILWAESIGSSIC